MGYIYKIYNDFNNKVYIGQTKKSIELRFKQHINSSKESNYCLHKAMREIGIEHFFIEQIEECKESDLNEREEYWIKEYNSFYSGYNMTFGGQVLCGHKIQEELYELIFILYDGNLSMKKIANLLNCSNTEIYNILKSYDKDEGFKKKNIQVEQYDLDGNYIKTFNSVKEACEETGAYSGNISKVCRGERGSAGGFKWKSVDKLVLSNKKIEQLLLEYKDFIPNKTNKTYIKKNSSVVYQIDKNTNEIIAKYNSFKEAENATGVIASNISKVCRRERKSAGGYFWKMEGE